MPTSTQQLTSYLLAPKVYGLSDINYFTKNGDWATRADVAQKNNPVALPVSTIRFGTDSFTFSQAPA
jgi:hypothetical protein